MAAININQIRRQIERIAALMAKAEVKPPHIVVEFVKPSGDVTSTFTVGAPDESDPGSTAKKNGGSQ
jgi:hypothetical protein